MTNREINRKFKIPQTLRELVQSRGKRPYNLWVCYSAKLNKDLYLSSDYALCHMVLLECDPSVVKYIPESPQLSTDLAGEKVTSRFDATVIYRDGHQEWHEVKSQIDKSNARETRQLAAQLQISKEADVIYRLVTDAEIKPKLQRVWNGLFMLSTLAAARNHSLLAYRHAILARLKTDDYLIRDLLDLVDQDRGLILAALFSLSLEQHVAIDIDSKPLSTLHRCRLMENHHAN